MIRRACSKSALLHPEPPSLLCSYSSALVRVKNNAPSLASTPLRLPEALVGVLGALGALGAPGALEALEALEALREEGR